MNFHGLSGTRTSSALLLLLLTAGMVGLPAIEPASAGPEPQYVGAVSRDHPRIMANSSDFDNLRSASETDSTAKGLRERVLAKATGLLSAPVASSATPSADRMYDVSQTVYDRVSTLALSWQLTKKGDYAERLWSELDSVTKYRDWNPQHFLDTSALSLAVSIGYDWVYGYWSADRRAALEGAIADKGLRPAQEQFNSRASWTTQTGNWNVVSNSGVGIAALAVRDAHPELADSVLNASLLSLKEGIKGFGPDGGYREGLQYWGYALSHVVQFAEALRVALGSDQGILSDQGVRATARYPLYMQGPSGSFFNYSDSKMGDLPPALFVLGRTYNDPVLTGAALKSALKGGINQFSLFWYKPNATSLSPTDANLPLDRVYSGANVVSMRSGWDRDDANFVAFKGATGSDNGHPHLDAGSFVLDALGVNWATELGPDSYSLPGYADGLETGNRWTYYRLRAEGSNTVGFQSKPGPDQAPLANSLIERSGSGRTSSFAIANLQPASPKKTNTWKRGIMLADNKRQFIVQDEIQGNGILDARWSMHTSAGIDISKDGLSAVLTKDGKQLMARLPASAGLTFSQLAAEPLPSSPAPSGQSSNAGVSKLSIDLSGKTNITVSIQFTPLIPGVPAAPELSRQPLGGWATQADSPVLADLRVGPTKVANFAPDNLTYSVSVAPGESAPEVRATAPAGLEVKIEQPKAVPGVGVVSVTRAGGSIATTYNVVFVSGQHSIKGVVASLGWATAPFTYDGDPLSKWVVGGNQSLRYDLGTAKTVAAVSISWAATGPSPSRFAVSTSIDGTTWNRQSEKSLPVTTDWDTTEFAPTTARYVKVDVDSQNVSNRYVGIYEVKILDSNFPRSASPPQEPSRVQLSGVPTRLNQQDKGVMQFNFADQGGNRVSFSGGTARFVTTDPGVLQVGPDGSFSAVAAGSARVGVLVELPSRRILSAASSVEVANPWTVTLGAAADTYVYGAESAVNTNFGDSQGLLVKQTPWPVANRESYLSFDLSSIAGKEVVSAELRVTAHTSDASGKNSVLSAREIQGSWKESLVTYATKPALGAFLSTIPVDEKLSLRNLDVTDYVKRAAQSGSLAGISLTQNVAPQTAGLLVFVYGKDSPRKPQLVITLAYVAPAS